MRYHQIAAQQANHQHFITSVRRAAAAAGLKSGFITTARRAATPHIVDCVGLTDEYLGYDEFKNQLCERRDWCDGHCPQDYEIEPIRDQQMRLVGRRFRFAQEKDAALFKMLFG